LKRRKKVQKKSTRSSKTSSIEYSVKTKRKGKSYEFAVVENKERTVKVFNFREKAICFLGDVGSISLGVIFSGCVVYYLSCFELQTLGGLVIRHPYLIFLFFFIYYLDVFSTLFKRLSRKENIFKPHRKHLYQFLANNYFKSHVKTSCLYAFLQLTINIIVISVMFSQNILLSNYMLYILCFYTCLIIFSYFYVQKKIVKDNS